jgi:hypothetical protein
MPTSGLVDGVFRLPFPGAGVTRAPIGAGALTFRIIFSLGICGRSGRHKIWVMKISGKQAQTSAEFVARVIGQFQLGKLRRGRMFKPVDFNLSDA